MKKQIGILDNFDGGGSHEAGGGDNRRDYFTMLTIKL
jgi:hypothetical protein